MSKCLNRMGVGHGPSNNKSHFAVVYKGLALIVIISPTRTTILGTAGTTFRNVGMS